MSLRASTGRHACPSRPPQSAPAPHPGDAVLATVPSHARLAVTHPSPPASHLRSPAPPLPRSPSAPRGKRHATPAPSSMVARFTTSSKPIAAGGAGAGAAAAVVRAATGKPAASSPPPSSSPTAPQFHHNPPNVPLCPVSSPHDVPRGQLRDIPHGQFRHRDSTTPSHGPHAWRRPLLVTGPRTAPRGQLRHATRECPLQSLRTTVRPHSTRLGCPRSWPSAARSKNLKNKNTVWSMSGAGSTNYCTPSIPHPTRLYAARILVSSSSEAQSPRFKPSEREKKTSFTGLDLTIAQRTAMLP